MARIYVSSVILRFGTGVIVICFLCLYDLFIVCRIIVCYADDWNNNLTGM